MLDGAMIFKTIRRWEGSIYAVELDLCFAQAVPCFDGEAKSPPGGTNANRWVA
jgi:hypothetical protein